MAAGDLSGEGGNTPNGSSETRIPRTAVGYAGIVWDTPSSAPNRFLPTASLPTSPNGTVNVALDEVLHQKKVGNASAATAGASPTHNSGGPTGELFLASF